MAGEYVPGWQKLKYPEVLGHSAPAGHTSPVPVCRASDTTGTLRLTPAVVRQNIHIPEDLYTCHAQFKMRPSIQKELRLNHTTID